jgi:AcrR family transcriptional regulator
VTSAVSETTGDAHTRERLIAVAVDLFNRHSYAGTSLQMIADELGTTKGATYHHFRTREDLLRAIVGPLLEHLAAVIDAAEARRSAHARAERMLTGYAAHIVAKRRVAAVPALDPGVAEVLRMNPECNRLIGRQIALHAGVSLGLTGDVKASMVLAGLAAAADPRVADIDDDALYDVLVESGRRTLGPRAPRGRAESTEARTWE